MADVLFHPEAQDDFETSQVWYARRSARAAARFGTEVERILQLIRANPEMFPKYDEDYRFAVLRRFPYSIIYQVLSEYIEIVAVAHAKRSAAYWKRRS